MAVRFGVIGCGVIGPVHAQAVADIADARLMAVCDEIPERAGELARTYEVDAVTEYHALLARPDIDAVCICTPHYLHAEMAVAAARAGKHVFCEKPMALDPADMDAMIAAARDAGVQLGVCFQHRFDPVIGHLKAMIDDGRFGTLLMGSAQVRCIRDADYYNSAAWRGTWAQEGGGVLINQAIHTIDAMLYLFGDPLSITGQMATLRWSDLIEVEDTAHGLVNFAGGALGQISATSASNLGWNTRLHVYGTHGSAVVNTGFPEEFTFLAVEGGAPDAPADEEAAPTVGKACYGNSHVRALAAFTEAVATGTPFAIPGEEGRRATEVVLGLYRSARAGISVALPLATATV
jgi:predicted dehydrogenase